MSRAPKDRVERALPIAMALVCAVRDGQDQTAEALEHAQADVQAVLVALAALVPDDRTPAQLLAWFHGDSDRTASGSGGRRVVQLRQAAACGTRSGYGRHRQQCEDPCDACREAERQYQATRHLRRVAARAAREAREAS